MGRWLVDKRLRGLTELETIEAQTGICGIVKPSLLPPATGWVCVHLPSGNPCKIIVMHMATRQIQLFNKDD